MLNYWSGTAAQRACYIQNNWDVQVVSFNCRWWVRKSKSEYESISWSVSVGWITLTVIFTTSTTRWLFGCFSFISWTSWELLALNDAFWEVERPMQWTVYWSVGQVSHVGQLFTPGSAVSLYQDCSSLDSSHGLHCTDLGYECFSNNKGWQLVDTRAIYNVPLFE